MKEDGTPKIGRRAVLGVALGGAAAAAAAALAVPATVLGADGDAMQVGQEYSATTATWIDCTGDNAFYATSSGADAFHGVSLSAGGSGVCGYALDPGGFGVYGRNVHNEGKAALGAPTAALWASQYGAPLALKVEGKASFSRSGKASIAAGSSYADVDLRTRGGLAGTPLCFANLLNYRSGVYVAAVRPNFPSTGKLRIQLNKAVASKSYAAWMVLN